MLLHSQVGLEALDPMNRSDHLNQSISMAGVRTLKPVMLAAAVCSYGGLTMGGPADPVGTIIFVCATISSIAGFAFSAISGAILLHAVRDPVEAVQIMLVASIALQAYSVWALRRTIRLRELLPYFAGGAATVGPGIYLLLNTPATIYVLALGGFLTTYGIYMLLGSPLRLQANSLAGRVVVGALGGITGATAAFPGAFITLWCAAHGWDKQQQRAIYQPFILGMQVVTLVVLAAFAPTTGIRIDLLQYAVPAILGAHLGLIVFSVLSAAQFNKVVSAFLVVSGAAMSLKAL
jgi:uncharacterized membrane protein YfcA